MPPVDPAQTPAATRTASASTASVPRAAGRFGRERRVRRRGEFQQVFEGGVRVHGRFITMIVLPNGRPASRLGLVASRKLGGAVQRNRAKRLIREMFRHEAGSTPGPAVDAVVIPKREILEAAFPALAQDFKGVWRRAAARAKAR